MDKWNIKKFKIIACSTCWIYNTGKTDICYSLEKYLPTQTKFLPRVFKGLTLNSLEKSFIQNTAFPKDVKWKQYCWDNFKLHPNYLLQDFLSTTVIMVKF